MTTRSTPPRVGRAPSLLAVVLLALVVGGPVVADAAPCWTPPVAGSIVDPFREPACRWCAGNRGLEYATSVGTPVFAVAAGTVVFVGTVAGVRYVVVRHASGERTTYGRLASSRVRAGDLVAAGTRLGGTGSTFHFGVRDGDRYVDPSPLLGRLVGRPRLVPTDGSGARPGPPPRLRCGGGSTR